VASSDVVHVIAPGLPLGGAEAVVEALASADRAHTQVFVLSQITGEGAPPHPFQARLRERGVRSREIRCGRRRYRAEVDAVEKELRTTNARVIHTHGYHADAVTYFAARRLHIPIVSTVHGFIRRSWKEHLYNVVDRRLLRRFNGVIGVSPAIVSELAGAGIAKEKLHFVPNGLGTPAKRLTRAEARAQLGLSNAGAVIGWIGRLSIEKGADLLLSAVAECDVPAHVVLIGEGPELPRLSGMLESFPDPIRSRISLAGYHANAAGLLSAFDVFALSSRSEGTPMVILEAVAAGVPIVSFAVGGIPDLLNDEIAFLVPAGDVQAFGSALTQAVTARQDAAARAGRAHATLQEALSPERWLDRMAQVYRHATSNGANGKRTI
jgi:glycosyltransferase involved in cell wall biosynthesis